MSDAPRFLTINDVSDVLNVSTNQVRVLLSSGDLRGIQVGRKGTWRIEAVELENYIARQYEQTDTRRRSADAGDHRDGVEHHDPSST